MNMFLNEQGLLRLDEAVANNPSWKKIMEDGIVTEEELKNQAVEVTEHFQKIEETFSEEQKKEVEALLVSVSVLFAAHNIHLIQQIGK